MNINKSLNEALSTSERHAWPAQIAETPTLWLLDPYQRSTVVTSYAPDPILYRVISALRQTLYVAWPSIMGTPKVAHSALPVEISVLGI